jgi:hypothetical protein
VPTAFDGVDVVPSLHVGARAGEEVLSLGLGGEQARPGTSVPVAVAGLLAGPASGLLAPFAATIGGPFECGRLYKPHY